MFVSQLVKFTYRLPIGPIGVKCDIAELGTSGSRGGIFRLALSDEHRILTALFDVQKGYPVCSRSRDKQEGKGDINFVSERESSLTVHTATLTVVRLAQENVMVN